ncbi:MAG: hypothetical protein AB1765_09230 [Candidatus Hydrogenedentota bacterium]
MSRLGVMYSAFVSYPSLGVSALAGIILCSIWRKPQTNFILIYIILSLLFFSVYKALFLHHVTVIIPLLSIVAGIGLIRLYHLIVTRNKLLGALIILSATDVDDYVVSDEQIITFFLKTSYHLTLLILQTIGSLPAILVLVC